MAPTSYIESEWAYNAMLYLYPRPVSSGEGFAGGIGCTSRSLGVNSCGSRLNNSLVCNSLRSICLISHSVCEKRCPVGLVLHSIGEVLHSVCLRLRGIGLLLRRDRKVVSIGRARYHLIQSESTNNRQNNSEKRDNDCRIGGSPSSLFLGCLSFVAGAALIKLAFYIADIPLVLGAGGVLVSCGYSVGRSASSVFGKV